MCWGKISYSNQNLYQTALSNEYLDSDLEDLVSKGFMTKIDLDSRTNPCVNESTGYFVTEKALDELMNLWGKFKPLWAKLSFYLE